MNQKVKYTVIVPVYNSEKTLERCLRSLLSTNRTDVQIVLINDGSVDSSGNIALEYAQNHVCLDYIHQNNGGVSHARNAGISKAIGTYITFVDSDDFVAPNYFDMLDSADDSDLVVFAHENVGGALLDETALFSKLQKLESAEGRLALLLSSRKIMSPWNKRFRRDIICKHSIRFIEGMSVGEDFNFCMAYAVHCESISILERPIIYNDVSDQNSLSRRYRPDLDDQIYQMFLHVTKVISDSLIHVDLKEHLLAIIDYLFVRHVFSCISEEFKINKLSYHRDYKRISDICGKFSQPVSQKRCGLLHSLLRLAIKWKFYFPFYTVSYLYKGRKYRK